MSLSPWNLWWIQPPSFLKICMQIVPEILKITFSESLSSAVYLPRYSLHEKSSGICKSLQLEAAHSYKGKYGLPTALSAPLLAPLRPVPALHQMLEEPLFKQEKPYAEQELAVAPHCCVSHLKLWETAGCGTSLLCITVARVRCLHHKPCPHHGGKHLSKWFLKTQTHHSCVPKSASFFPYLKSYSGIHMINFPSFMNWNYSQAFQYTRLCIAQSVYQTVYSSVTEAW